MLVHTWYQVFLEVFTALKYFKISKRIDDRTICNWRLFTLCLNNCILYLNHIDTYMNASSFALIQRTCIDDNPFWFALVRRTCMWKYPFLVQYGLKDELKPSSAPIRYNVIATSASMGLDCFYLNIDLEGFKARRCTVSGSRPVTQWSWVWIPWDYIRATALPTALD